ncbi:MAG: hypothetical protein IKY16_06545 [Bacteroidales bacterium]|nr:hypothetical protein [Bacteroidales bacterium]
MAKTKRISVNGFEKVMKTTYEPMETFEWNGLEVTVCKTLSLKDMITFVNSVVNSCFVGEADVYTPEAKEFAVKTCILEKYANFTMPANAELQYDLIYRTDIVKTVCAHINMEQLNEILSAIDSKVNAMVRTNVKTMELQIKNVYDQLDQMSDRMQELFGSFSSEDMKNVTTALLGGKMDEEKVVQAFLKHKMTASSGKSV